MLQAINGKGKTMSQQTAENGSKPLVSNAAAKQSGVARSGEKKDHERHQAALKKSVVAGAAATLKPSAPPTAHQQTSTPAAMSPRPMTPAAALGPGFIPPKRESKPSQAGVPQFQKAPATTTAPKSAPPTPQPTASDKATTVLQTPTPTASRAVDVRFVLSRPGSKRVSLCGEFNGWSPDATPMKQGESRCWEATLALRPGRYEYKFVVDGQWLHDPNARENLPNPHGSLNSVMEVRI
jgi:hypothetical protein